MTLPAAWSVFLLALFAQAAAAQDDSVGTAQEEAPSCLRFRFGPWTPTLDWKRSGHPSAPDSVRVARAAGGQAWAMGVASTPTVAAGDTLLVLYPGFWPAGVSISFNPRAFATADTVTGTARALVADGNQPTSTARATLWRVRCR